MRTAIVFLSGTLLLSAQGVNMQGLQVPMTKGVTVNPANRPNIVVNGQPQQQPVLPTGKSSISGKVVNAVTNEPVKKATVNLSGVSFLVAVTDGAGHFAFRDLPAGQYNLQATSDAYPVNFTNGVVKQVSVKVGADDSKDDVVLALSPGISISGRVVDEEGSPLAQCSVGVMSFIDANRGRTLNMMNSAQSDEQGEYRLTNVPPGKYYISARCAQSIPLPHAFMRRTPNQVIPSLTYPVQFYPSEPDESGRGRLQFQPGANLSGINFRMNPASGVTILGRVRGQSTGRGLQVVLQPRESWKQGWLQRFGPVNLNTGEFRVPDVPPGSYDLVATERDGATMVGYAKLPIEVGSAAPEPVELMLSPGTNISGTLTIESDSSASGPPAPALKNMRVMLNPAESIAMAGAPQPAEVQPDGTFSFRGVVPGRWRVNVMGPGGFLKSISVGDQETDDPEIDLGASPGNLKIVWTNKMVQVDADAPTPPSDKPMYALVFRTKNDFQQVMPFNQQGRATLNVPPGELYGCVIATTQPWNLTRNQSTRKALEDHCDRFEAREGSRTSIRLPVVSEEDMKKILEDQD